MKKLIYMAGAALVMLASASCEKKETVKEAQSSVEKVDMVFTATSDNGGLKTTIVDNTKAVWSSTDNLKVFTAEDQTGSVCNYKSGAGTATAEFEGQCAKKGPWTAICPAGKGTGFADGTITFTMPENQTYATNTFADGAMPCVAYSETNTFNFKHSFGVLKLSLKLKSGKTGSVKSITVTTKGSEKLNGTFTVNPQTSAAATYSTGGTSSVTLNCTSVALSESTATDFWIVVPEGAFASGFDVTVTPTSEDLLPATLSTTKANTITAGEVNKMPVQLVEFKIPTTGYADRKEGTGTVKVKWVQLWENGPKWAEYNVGATTVGEYGGYYAWGGSQSTVDDHNTGTDPLSGDSDTATKLWGSNWQMATTEDFDALFANCDVEWKSADNSGYGVAGRLYTGKDDYAGNSVFFPAAGYYGFGKVNFADRDGDYWSSAPNGKSYAYTLYFTSGSQSVSSLNRMYGYSVRAVLNESN
ncbi:MAG: hypothetical protein MJ010_05455 [Paludibacteraceae bacterium]|nr:hypothetical protein [Paludibacteraceae bacterium]